MGVNVVRLERRHPHRAGAIVAGYVLDEGGGGRRGEIISLRWKNVDYENGAIIFSAAFTKDSEDRIVPIDDYLIELLKANKGDNEELIVPYNGNWVYRVYKRYALAAGITEKDKLKLHATRHTCASHMAKKGVSPFAIMNILGHSDLETTMIYVQVTTQDCKEAINSLPWVNNRK